VALTWTIGSVTITPPAGEWGYEVADIGVTIPVISGFSPSVVGRSAGRRGERGTIVHLERNVAGGPTNYEAIVTSIRAKIDALLPSPPGLGYHDAVFPDWSGRVRVVSCTPRYGRNSRTHGVYGYLTISYERVS
jgi:hypothetical protein